MKPFSKTLGVTPELLMPLKFTYTLRRGVIQEPANIWAPGGNCLSAETALIFLRTQRLPCLSIRPSPIFPSERLRFHRFLYPPRVSGSGVETGLLIQTSLGRAGGWGAL